MRALQHLRRLVSLPGVAPVSYLLVLWLFVAAGCRPDDTSQIDSKPPPDLSSPTPIDMARSLPDLTALDMVAGDPCGTAMPGEAPGQIIARCVIGSPPVVDGDLGDWALASLHVARSEMTTGLAYAGAWPSNVLAQDSTLSADVWTAWDSDYLYFAARVRDEQVRSASTPNAPWTADAVELFIDGDQSRSSGYDGDDRRLVLPFDIITDPAANFCGADRCGANWPVVAKTRVNAEGWQLEARIPWSSIGGIGTAARTIGFDLQFDDDDAGTGRDRLLIWYLDPSHVMGGNPPVDSMILPPLFGRLVLGPR